MGRDELLFIEDESTWMRVFWRHGTGCAIVHGRCLLFR